MYRDCLIIDAVAHAYDRSRDNCAPECAWNEYARINRNSWLQASVLEPVSGGFDIAIEEWTARWSGEALVETYFLESDVDIVIHHSVHIPAIFRKSHEGGASRWDEGLAMKRAAPERVYLYGGVDTFEPDRAAVFAQMERMAAQGAIGFKFYPSYGFFDQRANEFVTARYDDPEDAYPFFEKARALGVRHLAFHKAQPISPGPVDVLRPTDLTKAAAAFPDMTFEVVHDGWAFLEESALQLKMCPNVYANLEIVANLVTRQRLRFAHILGTLLRDGNADRILFATGCGYNHPAPIAKALAEFEMPEDLREGYGYPEVTPEIKRKILGANACALLGIDPKAKAQALSQDEWAQRRAATKVAPWSSHRRRLASDPRKGGGWC